MRKVKIICGVLAILIVLMIAIPMSVSAVSGGDALAGLKEFYSLLILLAGKGLEAYVAFLGAL